VLGIPTRYAESLLSVKYRAKTRKGTILGGPMATIESGLRQRWLAIAFCGAVVLAAFSIGNMIPSYTFVSLIDDAFDLDPWVTGSCITVFIAIVIIGGTKSIAETSKKLVPAVVVFYVVGCLVALLINGRYLLPAITLIATSAFSGSAAGGGFAGAGVMMAMRYGFEYGMITNQAGFGSAPIIAAAARSDNPVRQALVSSTVAFWDTVVVSAITGLVLVTGILKNPSGMPQGQNTLEFASAIFGRVPAIGQFVFIVSMTGFLFSAVISWSYFAERSIEYLFKKKGIPLFRYCWVLAVFFGALLKPPAASPFAHLVGELSIALLALMAIINLFSLWFLNGVVVSETKKYLWDDPANIENSHHQKQEIKKGATGPENPERPAP